MLEYINRSRAKNELSVWNVVVVSPPDSALGEIDLSGASNFKLVSRSKYDRFVDDMSADIKALISENDVVADMPQIASLSHGEGQELLLQRRFRDDVAGPRGLLLLYPISKNSMPTTPTSTSRAPLEAVANVIGMAVVFPQTDETSIKYVTAKLAPATIEQVEASELEAELA